MKINRTSSRIAIAVALLTLATGVASAQGIVNATRGGSSANTVPAVIPLGLEEGAPCFVDRTHAYANVPATLLGIDYIQVANNDKTVADYSIDVDLGSEGILYVFIDYRVGDDDGATPPDLTVLMPWVATLGFLDTGEIIDIDENADGSIDQSFAVYSLEAEAGTVTLGEQNDGGGRNMYGIAFSSDSGPSVCPVAPRATPVGADIELGWANGEEIPDSVDILRGGTPIAEGLPADPPSYLDIAVPPGLHEYEFRFDVDGTECTLTTQIDTCLRGLSGIASGGAVELSWTNVTIYDGIRVLRDGEELAVIAGDQTAYTDDDPVEGLAEYSVQPSTGDCNPQVISVDFSPPQGIASILREGSSAAAAPLIVGSGLQDGAACFVDRAHVYTTVPEWLIGADYVQVANDDKTTFDYALTVEVAASGTLYLFIDNRVGDDDGATPPDLSVLMTWVADEGFEDTGHTIDIDEGNDGSVENSFAIYALEVEDGSYTVWEQNDGGGRNMYGVAFLPEGSGPVCPAALGFEASGSDLQLTWVNGAVAPDSVDIFRDGGEVADDAPADPPLYLDTAVPPGYHAYELIFALGGEECTLTGEIDTCPTGLTARVSGAEVTLEWQNVTSYEGIVILRNGEELAEIGGDLTTFIDDDPPEGLIDYQVQPTEGDCAALIASVTYREPQGIIAVERLGASVADPPGIVGAGLEEGALLFVDRTHVFMNVDENLVGADYVQPANDDKETPDYSLDVTTAVDGFLYLLVDNRIGDDDNTTPPDLTLAMLWVDEGEWEDTGWTVEVDEGGDGTSDQVYTVYEQEVEAGSYVTLEQNNTGNRNMYIVAFVASGDPPVGPVFHRGDADNSGVVNITDGISILNFLFLGGETPPCMEAADTDDSGAVNITDGIAILNFLFLGGVEPAPPGPPPSECGPDPEDSPGDLGCVTYTGC